MLSFSPFDTNYIISTLVTDLCKLTKLFRSPPQLKALKKFFIEHRSKSSVMRSLAVGFKSKFEYPHPPPWGHVENYPPLLSSCGRQRLREVMKAQVQLGKMIGGPGWSSRQVSAFFGGDS